MPFIARYIDSLSAPLFKIDDMGRQVYFAAGIWGRGRVVHDIEEAVQLRGKVRRACSLASLGLLPLIILSQALIGVLPMLLLAVASVGGLQAYLMLLGRRFPITEARLSLRNAGKIFCLAVRAPT